MTGAPTTTSLSLPPNISNSFGSGSLATEVPPECADVLTLKELDTVDVAVVLVAVAGTTVSPAPPPNPPVPTVIVCVVVHVFKVVRVKTVAVMV
jgi:hypothetical protein